MSVAINSSPAGALNQGSSWKRKRSDDEDESQADSIKKAKYSWYLRLESESPVPTDEDEESIYTMQGNETEFACDTSDTSTHTWVSSSEHDVSVHVEYELDSLSENENPFINTSSGSEPENISAVAIITFCDTEGLADDSDDSISSFDSEIRKADFWTCVLCKNPNNNPLFQFCEKCYQVRKSHFSRDRPRRKPRIQKDQGKKSVSSGKDTVLRISTQEFSEMDSGLGSSQDLDKPDSQGSDITTITATPRSNSQNSKTTIVKFDQNHETSLSYSSQDSEKTIFKFDSQSSELSTISTMTRKPTFTESQLSEKDEVDSGVMPKELDSDDTLSLTDNSSTGTSWLKGKVIDAAKSDDSGEEKSSSPLIAASRAVDTKQEDNGNVMSSIPKTESETERQSSDSLCQICTVRPKNGIFVHGKTSHIICCYRCAMKVWATNDNRCPMCKRKVTQVSKAFYG